MPGQLGYNHIFQQVFAAHEQRLPLEALLEFAATRHVTPGERLLPVSNRKTNTIKL